MSFLEYRLQTVPTGLRKVLHLNWALILLLTAVCSVGWLMLYSVAGGDLSTWAEPQMKRFAVGLTEGQQVHLLERAGKEWKTVREWPASTFSHTALMTSLRHRQEPGSVTDWIALLPQALR